MALFLILSFACLLVFAPDLRSQATKPKKETAASQEWKVIAKFGQTWAVYVSPKGIKDKQFIAQILHSIVSQHGQGKVIQVWFFDDKRFTPKGVPMTDEQMLHWKARYNFNPNTKFEEFAWIKVVDPKKSPPLLKETNAKIRPSYAE